MPELDPRLAALGRDVERATRRLGNLEALVRQLAADVTALARLAAATDADGDAEDADRVRAWLTAADPDQAADDLADLVAWLTRVYLRYPGAVLPSCWLWHPAAIEELWWLRHAHHDAYTGDAASWTRAGDWHDRYRPGVAKRLHDALGGCELALHVPGGPRAPQAPNVPLAAAADLIAAAWTDPCCPGGQPQPTAQHLTDAEAHDHAQHSNPRR